MNLEQGIAEALRGHWSASTHTGREPFVDKCDGCGTVIYTWGGTGGSDALAAHQADVLAGIVREGQAEALREAARELDRLERISNYPEDACTAEENADYEAWANADLQEWLGAHADKICPNPTPDKSWDLEKGEGA